MYKGLLMNIINLVYIIIITASVINSNYTHREILHDTINTLCNQCIFICFSNHVISKKMYFNTFMSNIFSLSSLIFTGVNFKEVNEDNKQTLFSEIYTSIDTLAFTFGNV